MRLCGASEHVLGRRGGNLVKKRGNDVLNIVLVFCGISCYNEKTEICY